MVDEDMCELLNVLDDFIVLDADRDAIDVDTGSFFIQLSSFSEPIDDLFGLFRCDQREYCCLLCCIKHATDCCTIGLGVSSGEKTIYRVEQCKHRMHPQHLRSGRRFLDSVFKFDYLLRHVSAVFCQTDLVDSITLGKVTEFFLEPIIGIHLHQHIQCHLCHSGQDNTNV